MRYTNVTMESESTSPMCPICLEGFDNSQPETEKHDSRCGHPIHRQCLQTLMRTGSYSCSICRKPFGDVQSAQDQPHLKRYVNMLKQKLPVAAVRQRMEADGVSTSVVDAFFTGGASLAVQDEGTAEPLGAEVDTAKYTKMLRVGMSEGAVRQRMEAAGISSEAINAFFCSAITS